MIMFENNYSELIIRGKLFEVNYSNKFPLAVAEPAQTRFIHASDVTFVISRSSLR